MQTLTVYDPAMCCTTGVCGPEIDPSLARFAADLNWLREQGVGVERINLAHEPGRFADNPEVKAILYQSRDNSLPAIVVCDKLVAHGRYPGRDELAAWLGLDHPPAAQAEQNPTASGCCASDAAARKPSGCC